MKGNQWRLRSSNKKNTVDVLVSTVLEVHFVIFLQSATPKWGSLDRAVQDQIDLILNLLRFCTKLSWFRVENFAKSFS